MGGDGMHFEEGAPGDIHPEEAVTVLHVDLPMDGSHRGIVADLAAAGMVFEPDRVDAMMAHAASEHYANAEPRPSLSYTVHFTGVRRQAVKVTYRLEAAVRCLRAGHGNLPAGNLAKLRAVRDIVGSMVTAMDNLIELGGGEG